MNVLTGILGGFVWAFALYGIYDLIKKATKKSKNKGSKKNEKL